MEQPKEALIDMLGRVAGVNVVVIAALAIQDPMRSMRSDSGAVQNEKDSAADQRRSRS